jgi:hypothetical protein
MSYEMTLLEIHLLKCCNLFCYADHKISLFLKGIQYHETQFLKKTNQSFNYYNLWIHMTEKWCTWYVISKMITWNKYKIIFLLRVNFFYKLCLPLLSVKSVGKRLTLTDFWLIKHLRMESVLTGESSPITTHLFLLKLLCRSKWKSPSFIADFKNLFFN